jgi:hypothetical protein
VQCSHDAAATTKDSRGSVRAQSERVVFLFAPPIFARVITNYLEPQNKQKREGPLHSWGDQMKRPRLDAAVQSFIRRK